MKLFLCDQVNTFGTVEDFWATMNHIASPSNLRIGCDYMLFKEGIVPKWEDPANQAGGRWIISADSGDRMTRARDADKFWFVLSLMNYIFALKSIRF